MFVCCECCVLSGMGLCDELIPRTDESYRRRVLSRNLVNEEALAHWGLMRQKQKKTSTNYIHPQKFCRSWFRDWRLKKRQLFPWTQH